VSDDPRSEEWTAEEREIFRDLPRERVPPPGLEERLVKELRRRGRLAPANPRWIRPLLQTAAAVLLVVGGVLLGRWSEGAAGGPEGEPQAHFMLLLYVPPGWSREAEAERVEEYGAWARRLAAEGRSVTGAPLGTVTQVLVPEHGERKETAVPEWGPEGLTLGGYFLIGAADFDSAVEVAESCPHLRHGGTVVVRALELEP